MAFSTFSGTSSDQRSERSRSFDAMACGAGRKPSWAESTVGLFCGVVKTRSPKGRWLGIARSLCGGAREYLSGQQWLPNLGRSNYTMENGTNKRAVRAITERGVKVAISVLWYSGDELSRALMRLAGRRPAARFVVLYYHEVP